MVEGDLVRNTMKPEWGVGVVVSRPVEQRCDVIFEHRGRVTVSLKLPAIERVDRAIVPVGSALLDPTRWFELAPPPDRRRARPQARLDASRCQRCTHPLKDSSYSPDRAWKSCPNCSVLDGDHHVFYGYPDAFGQSRARTSAETPDGAQSHCSACRSRNPPTGRRRYCYEVV